MVAYRTFCAWTNHIILYISLYSHIPKVNNIYFMDKGTLLVAFPFLPSPLITGYV